MDFFSSINKVYSSVANEESNTTFAPIVNESNILTNAYDAKQIYGRGRGINYEGNDHNNSRYCIIIINMAIPMIFVTKSILIHMLTNLHYLPKPTTTLLMNLNNLLHPHT